MTGERRSSMTDTWASLRTWRPVAMGRRGAVVTNHPLATEAAMAIFRRGGNAIDAYLAAASTIGVVEPHMSGVGGEGFATVFSAAEGRATVVNASGRSPIGVTPDHFKDGIPPHGAITAITPSLVAGWCDIHARWGSLPLPDVLESAI